MNTGEEILYSEQAMAPESVFDAAAVRRLMVPDFTTEILQMNLQRGQIADTHFVKVEGIEITDIDFSQRDTEAGSGSFVLSADCLFPDENHPDHCLSSPG